jgi:hypothetical protein
MSCCALTYNNCSLWGSANPARHKQSQSCHNALKDTALYRILLPIVHHKRARTTTLYLFMSFLSPVPFLRCEA